MASRCRGIGIVAVLVIIGVLTAIGGVITVLVATGQVSRTNDLVREQAFGLVQAGFEYALKRLDDGVNPDGDARPLGQGQFTVGYNSTTGLITINSNVSGLQGSSSPQYSIQGPTSGNMANCLTINVAGAYLQSVSKDQLRGVTLQNTCNVPITIASMTVSWSPSATERMTQILINGVSVYAPPQPGIPSGGVADIIDTVIPACTTVLLDLVRFDSPMDDKNFTLLFTMSDGTSKSAFVQFVADNEAACLNVDLTAAYVNYTGYVRLQGGTVSNSCSPPVTIELTGMTVSWTPTSPTRRLTQIQFDANPVEWTGSVTSGTTVTLTTPLELAAGDSEAQTYLQFNGDMRARNFTLVYRMSDGTTKTVTVDNMAACLQVSTAAECIGPAGTYRELQGQVWSNACAGRIIVVDRVTTSWNGGGSRRWTNLRVNGTDVWTGSLSTGGTANLSPDVSIGGGSSVPVNFYRFNNDMRTRTFTHTIILSDTSSLPVAGFNPPNCP